MKILSFELTMPNRGSWNGKWSGQDKKYYIVSNMADSYMKKHEHFADLLKNGHDSYHYSWSDGWGANVSVEIIDSKEAKRRRKISAGFCGYDWMVDSILRNGKILAKHEEKELLTQTN